MPKKGYNALTLPDSLIMRIDALVDINVFTHKTRQRVLDYAVSKLEVEKGDKKWISTEKE